jgi:hypothetical protein
MTTILQMKEMIDVKLVETNFLTRWPCTICGGHTEKEPILAEGIDTSLPHPHTVRVCERCLEKGRINDELAEHAEATEQYAAYLRGLIGRLRVPTYGAWKTAYEAHEERWVRENTGYRSIAEYRKWEAHEAALREPLRDDEMPF